MTMILMHVSSQTAPESAIEDDDTRGLCANHCATEGLKLEHVFALFIDSRHL